jgi:1,4-dihydroxy-2-naphthoate octaprenyltransferase
MKRIRAIIPTRSALIHLRFPFSFFLMPVYFFALSQVPVINTDHALLVFIIWHLLAYPASNGYNSYFDKDEGSIALVEKPPKVDKSLYYFSFFLELVALLLSLIVSISFMFAVLIYGILSKLYSHPAIRLKKYPLISFLIVFIFQGAFIYWTSYAALSDSGIPFIAGKHGNINFLLAGLICSCLIGASYPLTQIYQHAEDSRRGDKTLSIVLGIRGSFCFSALLFGLAVLFLFFYWDNLEQIRNFQLFLLFVLPVFGVFLNWFVQAWKDETKADFKNMSRMTIISGSMMMIYFLLLNLL